MPTYGVDQDARTMNEAAAGDSYAARLLTARQADHLSSANDL